MVHPLNSPSKVPSSGIMREVTRIRRGYQGRDIRSERGVL